MSCLGPDYNPFPTREWSRVENVCVYDNFNTINYLSDNNMKNKANVLQYKKNSSQLTKQQRYAQIAKGYWTNRTTTWATQTESYTNPNTQSLQRENYTNITTNGVPTFLPITCNNANTTGSYSMLPSTISAQGTNPPPVLPPPPPPVVESSNNVLPNYPNTITEPAPVVVIPEGGYLNCNVVTNICTGVSYTVPKKKNCFPTTDSDVPGPIMDLCYDPKDPTWYPRQRYTMSNSTNKWPQGSKFIRSASSLYPSNLSTSDVSTVTKVNITNNNSQNITNSINGIIYINTNDDYYIKYSGVYYIETFTKVIDDSSTQTGFDYENSKQLYLPTDIGNLKSIVIVNLLTYDIALSSTTSKIFSSISNEEGDNNMIIENNSKYTFTHIVNPTNLTSFWSYIN